MRRAILHTIISFLTLTSSLLAQEPVDFVNPLMGSLSSFEFSSGNTYPIIGMPWGMNSWTPHTAKLGDGWQYSYSAHRIRGFKLTHQPSPWINDYGQLSIMAFVSERAILNEDERASWFSHKSEQALPYYYKVYLADWDVVSEMIPSERACLMRFTFPKQTDETKQRRVQIDALEGGSKIWRYDNETIVGYSTKNSGGVPDGFRCYFALRTKSPIKETIIERKDSTGHSIASLAFDQHEVECQVAASFISVEQALINLKEIEGLDAKSIEENGRKLWNEMLGRIHIEGGSEEQTRTFYSCLYRCLLFPRRFYEIDASGHTVHYSPYNGKIEKGYLYTDTGFWDSFRALFPLLNLIYPEENLKIQEGLLNSYRESGFYPEWASPGHRGCMVGNNSASVLADAYLSGIKVADTETLLEGLLHACQAVHPEVSSTGRLGWEYYNELGYIPADVGIHESAARTLEYAYADWCIYKLGKEIGLKKKELNKLAKRAKNYSKLFDPSTNLMRGRLKDGNWQEPFSPYKWGEVFTEGNAWHYTWSVFHDVEGLIGLMGGETLFNKMLDSVFLVPPLYDASYYGFPIHEIREMQVMNMGNYAHGNQPIQHMIYLYNYAREPWKAQYWVREVMDRLYHSGPDGYCGDEDNGQTSAWYVFSALGFYPVCPGSNQYVIGSPLFTRATIRMPNGKYLLLDAQNNSRTNRYIKTIRLGNGSEWSNNFFTRDLLQAGGIIRFEMQSEAAVNRGIKTENKPYSFSCSD